jgi:hypothetical protein
MRRIGYIEDYQRRLLGQNDQIRQDRLMAAFEAGRKAGDSTNLYLEDNPFPRNTALHVQWFEGWMEGAAKYLTEQERQSFEP